MYRSVPGICDDGHFLSFLFHHAFRQDAEDLAYVLYKCSHSGQQGIFLCQTVVKWLSDCERHEIVFPEESYSLLNQRMHVLVVACERHFLAVMCIDFLYGP